MKSDLKPGDSILLVIDIQEKFRNVISGFDDIVVNSGKLINAFGLLKIPMLFTEQYPKGLGETVEELKELLGKNKITTKISFDCFGDKKFLSLLSKKKLKNLVLCGIEAHVCVFQTALSALAKGYNVYLVADAVSSRKKSDYEIALRRMGKEGVKIVSTEMIIFQMIKDNKDKNFKKISKIVK